MSVNPRFTKWKLASALVALALFLFAVSWLLLAQRHLSEYRYMLFLENSYLTRAKGEAGKWPVDLVGVEQLLAPKIDSPGEAVFLVHTHRSARPTLEVIRQSESAFDGLVRFHWLGGRAYRIRLDLNRRTAESAPI